MVSNNKKKNDVVIIGTIPPPIGGVTVHVERLVNELDLKSINYIFWDFRNGINTNPFKYIIRLIKAIMSCKNSVVHYQINNVYEGALLAIMSKVYGFKLIYTVHSFIYERDYKKYIKRIAYNKLRENVSVFVAPSIRIQKSLLGIGVAPEKIRVISTYVPPTKNEKDTHIPETLKQAFYTDKIIVMGSAFCLYRADGVDVYGLDMCIEACCSLRNTHKFIFCVPWIKDQEYYRECLERIRTNHLEESFYICTEPVNLVGIYKYCDIFVRPSSTDSYGISVAEALNSGVQTIASDVCERADGCILFQARDVNDFINKIVSVDFSKGIKSNITSCTNELLELYRSLNTKGFSVKT